MKKIALIVGVLVVIGIVVSFGTYRYVVSTLPQIISVADYHPLMVSQVYDRNGQKIGEFAREPRTLINYDKIPKNLVNAFLAAEDDKFFEHNGVNYMAILRATMANLRAGRTVQGGSTITQQVAKTFFLSSEKTILRKVKDILLAQKLEENLKKEEILFLYLNQIFFGQQAYGIVTAAETYFRKPVEKLSLAEIAILAGLPKAPSAFNPIRNPSRAKERQVYVLNRMAEVGYISKEEAHQAAQEPVRVFLKERYENYAPHFLEIVRQMLVAKLGEEAVLDHGLKIYTSLDLPKQKAAQEAAIRGLKELDKRQGFRGALRNTTDPKEVGEFLLSARNKLIAEAIPERIIEVDGQFRSYGPLNVEYDAKKGLPFYAQVGKAAEGIVSKIDDQWGLVYVRMAELEGIIDFESMQWARKPNSEKRYDLDLIKKPSQALQVGDVVLMKLSDDKFSITPRLTRLINEAKKKDPKFEINFSKYAQFELDQQPLVEASLLSFDQNNGDVIAHVGGVNFTGSKWDKALQAARQTGSSFKSIVYASAFDKGYTASSPIMDAPIVFEETKEMDEGQEDTKVWKPENHGKSFGGDIIFRNAIVRSLNIPTVKIIEDISVHWVAEYARRLGIFSPLNMDFTLGLGSSSVTLYEMTKVFAEFGRMGKRIHPVFIRKVTDSEGKPLLETVSLDERFTKETTEFDKQFEERRKSYLESIAQENAQAAGINTAGTGSADTTGAKAQIDQQRNAKDKKSGVEPFFFFEDPEQLIKPTTAYLITSLLKAVVEDKNGTGGRAKSLGREVAGKTGTTNGYFDAWFVGFSPQIVTGVWVGFEHEKTLGKGEVGGRSALPIWVDYMKAAHEGLPVMTLPVPEGIVFANIDSESGALASSSAKSIVRQAYLEGTEPSSSKNKKEEDTDFYKQDLQE